MKSLRKSIRTALCRYKREITEVLTSTMLLYFGSVWYSALFANSSRLVTYYKKIQRRKTTFRIIVLMLSRIFSISSDCFSTRYSIHSPQTHICTRNIKLPNSRTIELKFGLKLKGASLRTYLKAVFDNSSVRKHHVPLDVRVDEQRKYRCHL